MRAHKKVEDMMFGSLIFTSKQYLAGTAGIAGTEEECKKLKESIEENGLGTMTPDKQCFCGAQN